MLTSTEIKAKYSNFHLEGYIYVHRTMAKNIEDMAKISGRLDSLSKEELSRLREWFEFVYVMIEHHHQEEDAEDAEFSFPAINRRFPVKGLEQLIADHEVLNNNLTETREKLRELEATTDPDQRKVIVARLQRILAEAAQQMKEHLTREEEMLVPLINDNYSKAEQIKMGKLLERSGMKGTPRQYATFGLPWFMSGLNSEEKADFLKTLPLPPKLLMRFFWNKNYEKFADCVALAA